MAILTIAASRDRNDGTTSRRMKLITRLVWKIRLNRVEVCAQAEPPHVLKCRSILGKLARIPGPYYRRSPLPRLVVSRDAAWAEREAFMYSELHGLTTQRESSGMIRLPLLPGRPLASILRDDNLSKERQHILLTEVIGSLARMHTLRS